MTQFKPLSAYRRVEDIEWGGIRGICLSPDGNTLVACGRNQYAGPACALLFDVETGKLKRKITSTLKGFYYSARYHPQGFLITKRPQRSFLEVRRANRYVGVLASSGAEFG